MDKHQIRIILWSVTTIAVIFLATFYYKNRPLSVETATAEQNIEVTVYGLGTVEAKILSPVGFEVGAALSELNADQGDTVKKGAILARLYSAEQQAKTQQTNTAIKVAEVRLKKALSTLPKMKSTLALAKENNKRSQTLLSRKLVSKEQADKTQMEEDVAVTELDIAQIEIYVAKAELANARALYDIEIQRLERHTLRAPYDGLVIERHKELGTVLSPGEAVFTMIDPKTVWILGYVDEARAGYIRVGQHAQVRLRSLPNNKFQGIVVRIDIESDRVNEERRVYIRCNGCPEKFYLGEQAEIFIQTAVLKEALLVPETAIDNFNGSSGAVWVVKKGRLQLKPVTFGHKTLDGRVEVIEGPETDLQVVTNVPDGIKKGRKVSLIKGE
ncbi:MAG: efflux RND transporter periplasmic adaptor subunit [Methylococcaceae bacterium]|nr:efflux RND transporter periplasmic adaptor subunit [Methylococcaceae bacterium]